MILTGGFYTGPASEVRQTLAALLQEGRVTAPRKPGIDGAWSDFAGDTQGGRID